MSVVESLIAAGATVAVLMFLTWVVSLIVKDASIVDVVWSFQLGGSRRTPPTGESHNLGSPGFRQKGRAHHCLFPG